MVRISFFCPATKISKSEFVQNKSIPIKRMNRSKLCRLDLDLVNYQFFKTKNMKSNVLPCHPFYHHLLLHQAADFPKNQNTKHLSNMSNLHNMQVMMRHKFTGFKIQNSMYLRFVLEIKQHIQITYHLKSISVICLFAQA